MGSNSSDFEDSLADSIVEANNKEPEQRLVGGYPVLEEDEFGFTRTQANLPHFLIARTKAFNRRRRESGETHLGLYTHEGKIYRDHDEVEENKKTMLELSQWFGPVKDYEVLNYWAELRFHLPKLCTRYMQIGGDLFWDTEKYELVRRKDLDEGAV